MTLFVAVFLPLLVTLGFWQLARGAEKRAMEMDYLTQLGALPIAAADAIGGGPLQRVHLQGHFTPELFLVDNQVAHGKVGYWMVQVFDDIGGSRFLANRGFIEAASSREVFPEVVTPTGQVRLVGVVWPFTGLLPMLSDDPWSKGWPKRIQRLDVARMSAEVGAMPIEIRLESGQPGVVLAAPFAQVLDVAKHTGYAVTWFALSLALAGAYLLFGIRKAHHPAAPEDQAREDKERATTA